MSRAEDIFSKIQLDGAKAIDEFILTQQSEELFLDFKRSADDGAGTVLHTDDRNNLSKAISGFGNSEGGVIVWGVECKRGVDGADLPKVKFPINNPKRFVSYLENAISGCTIPPHSGVKNHAVVLKSGNGFVATYISKSETSPHQDVSDKRYYIRAGSNFVPTPHDVLAGMFGKRPQPNVFNMFVYSNPEVIGGAIKLQVGFMLRNNGKVLARDLFMSIWIISFPGPNCTFAFEPAVNDPSWRGYWSFGRNYSVVSEPELRLPPKSQVQPVTADISLAPPFTDNLKIDITCGCDGGILYNGGIENSSKNIENAYKEILGRNAKGLLTDTKKLRPFVLKLMGDKTDQQ